MSLCSAFYKDTSHIRLELTLMTSSYFIFIASYFQVRSPSEVRGVRTLRTRILGGHKPTHNALFYFMQGKTRREDQSDREEKDTVQHPTAAQLG